MTRVLAAADRSRWSIVVAVFVTLFFILGGASASGVFFLPVIKTFGWSRAELAALVGVGALAAGFAGPVVGWLVDRAGVRLMMIGGALMIALCYVGLSRANSLGQFAVICVVAGIAAAASTIIPCSFVITNCFTSERGLALGVAFAGIPLGGTVITIFANYVVEHHGWRMGYIAMGLPVALVVVPTLALYLPVRAADPPASGPVWTSDQPASFELPGLELRDAIWSRSFWMIALAQLALNTAWIGLGTHFIPYLIGVGYTASAAAAILSIGYLLGAVGSSLTGLFADRLNARIAVAAVCACSAAGIIVLFAATKVVGIAACLMLFWAVNVTPVALMPILIADSLGFKQLGALLGIQGVFATIGYAVGPVIAGRIYDVTASYGGALWLFMALSLVAAAAILGCLPLAEEQLRRSINSTAVASQVGVGRDAS
jgi:MFS family permease